MENLSDSVLIEYEDFTTYRHNLTKPPAHSYFYFPQDIEIIELNKTNPKKQLRRIFQGGVKYNDFELENLSKFKEELKKRDLSLPSYWEECNTYRFLQASGYDHSKTILLILEHLEWRKINFPVILTDKIKQILNSGFIYIHGRDNRFRPLIVFDPNIFSLNKKKFVTEDWILSLVFFFEYVTKNCFIPGQIENWNIICDVSKVSVLFLPSELKIILNTLQCNYRCRLYVAIVMNVSFLMKSIWNMIKMMLDESTERKVKLLNNIDDVNKELFKFINKSQLEKRFGGEAENLERKFFPPFFPSNEYFTENDDLAEILVNEEKYVEIIRNNDKLVPSPYVKLDVKGNEVALKNEIMNDSVIELDGKFDQCNLYFFYIFSVDL